MTCNCADFPFEPDPPCFDTCAGRCITYASPSELSDTFLIPDEIIEKLTELKSAGTAITLEDYTRDLDQDEKVTLNNIFKSLSNNNKALNWIKVQMTEPDTIDELS
ncbi:hypothetical protein [Mucilaginibacter sp.]|uniref:hypothetical protein n=1 Tax=Mucilaginibacter sp. TaxID=1882438 RepID=UPI0028493011|nr:hypothetical protein [Mucilaginibacter sp.]MDR3697592.1 hypothetical protein [Mucilaginibacter sp.]